MRLWPLLLLAGCQTVPPAQIVSSAPVTEAKTAVIAPCVEDVDPLPQTAIPPRTAGTDALAAGAAADLVRYRELARKQREILLGCAKAKP